MNIDSGGKPIAFLNNKDADELNVTASERVTVKSKKKITAIINTSSMVKRGFLGVRITSYNVCYTKLLRLDILLFQEKTKTPISFK